jgi:hypothetical protein
VIYTSIGDNVEIMLQGIAQTPAGIDGKNLLPHLRGQTATEPHKILFWRTTEHAALQRMRKQPKGAAPVEVPHLSAVRDGKWKFIVIDDAGKKPALRTLQPERGPIGET